MPGMRTPLAQIDYLAHLEAMWQKAIAPREPDAPKVISTFAGGGGSLTGYLMAGFDDLLAVEWEANAVETLRLNWPDLTIYHGDIAKLSVEEAMELAGVRPGELDVLDGSPPCFPAGSQVLTDSGLIAIEQCVPGTRVLTDTGYFEPVEELFARQYEGELFTIELKYGRRPITCTPEHPIYARRRITIKRNGNRVKDYLDPEWIPAQDLCPGDLVLEPHIVAFEQEQLKVISKQRINIAGESGSEQSEMRLLERDLDIDPTSNDIAWILGFYLAEGHFRGRNPTLEENGPCRREVVFSIARNEVDLLADKLRQAGIEQFNICDHTEGAARAEVRSLGLWVLCQTMGKGASGKFIPPAFHAMPVEWQDYFLDGYFAGDGCVVRRRNSLRQKATTVSWGIASGIARMIARTKGLVASIQVLYPAGVSTIAGREVKVRETYSVSCVLETSNRTRPGSVDEQGAWIPVKAVTPSIPQVTTVYNLEVHRDHSYTVEGIAVHNCQGFSTSGRRQLDDPRNQLFREYTRLLRGLRPKVFVMENVSGMVKGKMKLIFAEILKELKASGYRVKVQLMNAMYFGVPQSRQRVIFIGVREDLGILPSHPVAQTRPVTLAEAARGINSVGVPLKGDLAKLGEHARPGENFADVRERLGYGDRNNFSTKKCVWSRPVNTIPKTMGASMSGLVHPDHNNMLSIPAIQRCSSFPDAYQFTDDANAWARMGNSVPPLFMSAIATHIREHILAKV